MRTYYVKGMRCGGCERGVARAIEAQVGEDTAVEADAKTGEARVTESADPQVVVFAIDTAGYTVERVSGAAHAGAHEQLE